MATTVAAAVAAELGLRTAADLRPAEARPFQGRGTILPVTSDIAPLLPRAGFMAVTAITAERRGATSLLWRILAGPTSAGAWCALVGMPRLYPLAATAAGVDLARVALVDPGSRVAEAAGTLAEGVAVVVVPSGALTAVEARRLAARARRSGTAVLWWETRPVSGAEVRLAVTGARWKGLRANTGRRRGAGRLDACELEVAARWRSGGVHRARLWPYGGGDDTNVVDLRPQPERGGAPGGPGEVIPFPDTRPGDEWERPGWPGSLAPAPHCGAGGMR